MTGEYALQMNEGRTISFSGKEIGSIGRCGTTESALGRSCPFGLGRRLRRIVGRKIMDSRVGMALLFTTGVAQRRIIIESGSESRPMHDDNDNDRCYGMDRRDHPKIVVADDGPLHVTNPK